MTYFPPLPQEEDPNRDWLSQWLSGQTLPFLKVTDVVITSALITSLTFDKITAASNTASLVIGAGGSIASSNYSAGSAGFIVNGDGSAEFNDIVVRGDIESGNWDGTSPANLATVDGGASAGFYLDSSVGSAQFEGNIFLGGNIVFTGEAGILDFGDGFDMRVHQDFPVAGQDTLWLRASTDDTDHVKIGPTTASDELKSLSIGALAIGLDFGTWSQTLPKGIIYDWGLDTTAAGGNLGAYPVNITSLAPTASVPAGVPVTILVWAWMRVDLTLNQSFAALEVTIGGTLPLNPALVEQDLTDSAGDTTSQSWHNLSYVASRSFTPGGTTVALLGRGGTGGGTQTYDDGALMYMVIVN